MNMENTYETESQVQKLRRIVENKEPIKDEAPTIYTPKNKGVMPEYDIRCSCGFIVSGRAWSG